MIVCFLFFFISSDPYVDLLGTEATIKGSGQITQTIIRKYSYTKFTKIIISLEPSSIGSGAFQDCTNVRELYISENIKTIDFGSGLTFRFCSGLEKIEVSPTNPSYSNDDQGILYNKEKTILYRAPNLQLIIIPSTVQILSEQCFQANSQIKSLRIPKSVTSIKSGFLYDISQQPYNLTFESGSTITELIAYSFSYQNFQKIIIPKSVNIIRENAFQYASIKELLFEEGSHLEIIAKNCFYKSAFTKLEFPSNLQSLNEASFNSCNELTYVKIPKSTTFIHQDAFTGCTKLSMIIVDPENQNYSIHNDILFSKDKKMLLIAPSNVTKIPIPEETEEVGKTAIQGCKLASDIELSALNQNFDALNGILYTKGFHRCIAVVGGQKSVQFHKDCEVIGDYAMYGCDLAESISFLGDKVKIIGTASFYLCTGFVDLDLMNVEVINDGAFKSTKNLITVTFSGQKLTRIGTHAFEISSVKKIYVPSTLKLVGLEILGGSATELFDIPVDCVIQSFEAQSFAYSDNLKTFVFPSNLKSISAKCFMYCSQLSDINFEHASQLSRIYDSAFINVPITGIVTFPVNLEYIDTNAFKGCRSVTKFVFPTGCLVNTIKSSSFSYCTSIAEFEVPQFVSSLDPSVLEGCNGLQSINVHADNHNFEVEDGILYDASWSLVIYPAGKGVGVLSSKITGITTNVFYRQTVLTSITFKADTEHLTSLKSNSFVECDNLQEIVFHKLLRSIDSASIVKCPAIRRLSFAAGSKIQRLSESLFASLKTIQEVEFERNSQLSSIGSRCFFGCNLLQSVSIPSTISTIEASAFEGCHNLSKFIFVSGDTPASSFSILERSFFDCKSLQRFDFRRVSSLGSESFQGSGLISANFTDLLSSIGDSSFVGCNSLSFVSYCGTNEIAGVGFDPNVFANVRFSFKARFSNCIPVNSLDSSCVYHPPPTAYPVCLSPLEGLLVDMLPGDVEDV